MAVVDMALGPFRNLPIRQKLTWLALLTTGLALLLASIALLGFELYAFRRDVVNNLHTQADIIADNSAAAVLFNDRTAAEKTLAALDADPHILAATIERPNGEEFAAYVRANRTRPPALGTPLPPTGEGAIFVHDQVLVYDDITVDRDVVGRLRVVADLEKLRALVLRYAAVVSLVLVMSLLASAPLLARVQRVIAGPILHLVESAKIVSAEKNYAVRAERTTNDELGLLVDTFNEMLTEIQRRDAALESARDAAEAANRTKDEFLAVVSHELRTPLTPIFAWIEMLRAGALDASGRHAVDVIERSARSQAQLIEDLLDVSRIISGKLRLDVQQVDPAAIIEAGVDSVRPTAEVKGVRLATEIDPLAGAVSGDPERLKQILWNLLSNAIRFTPKGGQVQVILRRANSHVEILVSDTGQGIAPEFLPFVFDRFRQADATTTRPHGGLGLGLAIVRHLVDLHGGHVRASSGGEGKGSTFTVELPVAPRTPVRERRRPATVRADGMAADAGGSLHGLRIVAVDDDDDTLDALRLVLESRGAVVEVAHSVDAGLELFNRWRPDLVISDIGMPGHDGYELIRRLRVRSPAEGGRVPALALTAYARVEDRLKVLAAGFQMHVSKPIEPDELIAVVASLADLARSRAPEDGRA
jgi:signal transduction histidine kinase/ActR/RegA family two-component response regulator